MSLQSYLSPRVAIVADDLTSAADAASPFVSRGLSAYVGRRSWPSVSADVVSVDTGSRGMDTAAAREAVRDATLRVRGAELLFKTIDSTLRGNVKDEIAVAYLASGRRRIVVAPAFPAAGRTTLDGVQLVYGIPVADSVFGRDVVHPARTSQVADLVKGIAADTFVLDATTQDDLNQQIAAFPDKREILWVGSPGIAKALAVTIAAQTSCSAKLPVVGSILVVIGSANMASRLQAKRLRGIDAVTCLCAPENVDKHSTSVLTTLVDKAERNIRTKRYDAVIASGGETMDALLQRLGITEFSIDGELESGFPYGSASRQSNCNSLLIAMKAGGFGGPQTLRDAAMKLIGEVTLDAEKIT